MKRSPLKGRKRSPEAIRKSIETRMRNRAARNRSIPNVEERIKDATHYLQAAKSAINSDYKNCLIGLALHTLRGTP